MGRMNSLFKKEVIPMFHLNTSLNQTVIAGIGNTPLLEIEEGIFIKCEFLNPTGSIKARLAWHLVDCAEKEGLLKKGDTIVEATSGNTGNALSMVAAARGYKMVVVMPDGFSSERVAISKALGAEVILTKGTDVTAARDKALELGQQENWYCTAQFDNEENIVNAQNWLGGEIVDQIPLGVDIDAVVQGVGTGGTLIGVGKALKAHNPNVCVYALEPEEAQTIKDGSFAPHSLEGIGDGFIPSIFEKNADLITGTVSIKSEDAVAMMKQIPQQYGMFIGPSSAANLLAARKLKAENAHIQNVVTFFCDIGEKYITDHFSL